MIYKIIVKLILSLHTFSYRLACFFCLKAEKGSHPKHRLMNYHKFFVDNIEVDDKVLDIGCSTGALTFDLAKKAKRVVAIDIGKEKIEIAKEKFSASNIKYLIGDATKDLSEEKFDLIVLSNVLEHIEKRTEFLKKIRSLAPKILIRVPMINRDWITLYKKELGLQWKLHNNHFIEYTLETFKQEIEQAELKIKNYSIQFGEIWAVVINT